MGKYDGDANEHAVKVECKGEHCSPGHEQERDTWICMETVDQRDSHRIPCTGFNATVFEGIKNHGSPVIIKYRHLSGE